MSELPAIEVDVDTSDEIFVVAVPAPAEIDIVEQDTLPEVDHVIEVITGPRGDPGEQGETGPGVPEGGQAGQVLLKASDGPYEAVWGDLHHVHLQSVPAAVWVIEHPLPFYPSISVVDSAGTQVEGEVRYPSRGVIEVEFASGFSGTAYLS